MGTLTGAVLVALAAAGSAESKVIRYLTGNAADVAPPLFGPAHDLGGGGLDADPAMQWLIDAVRGCTDCDARLDVVVLRSSGADDYNGPISARNGVDSVETLVVTSAGDANRPEVAATVANAEVVFFAGGDRCDELRAFKGTALEAAVESVHARGGGVGGTSAGSAIQGDFVYDGCSGSALSSEALANPYDKRISFSYGFFEWPDLEGTLAEIHFIPRDRMGRLMAFLARQVQDGVSPSALGVAVNEATSLVVDAEGLATVLGEGPVYFVLADHVPEVCQPRKPLTYSNFKIWKLASGESFDLKYRPADGYYTRSVFLGSFTADPY